MLRRIIPILAIVCATAAPLFAQIEVDPKPAIEAVGEVAFLVGTWSGEGWVKMGQSPKQEFTQTETVESKLDGALLIIEGIGHSKGEPEKKGHHALAVVAFDPEGKTLVFSSFMAGRPRLDVVPEVGESTFTWSFPTPSGGYVRYAIKVEDDTWHETGEFSIDGESWHPFFEMSLKKQ